MKNSNRVKKAIIPAAGLGTRFLPATKAQPKEMLPVVDKPAIQYVVEEAVAAGLKDLLIITGRGKRAIEDHFDRSFELEHYLESSGRLSELSRIQEIAQLADFHYVRQASPRGLGDAVSAAKSHVGNEPFAVLLADDLMDIKEGVLNSMLQAYSNAPSTILALKEVSDEEISLYGCVEIDGEDSSGLKIVTGIVEKPDLIDAPSNLAVMGRYVFTPSIFEALNEVTPGKGGEIQLTDAIDIQLKNEPVRGFVFSKGRYDIGNKIDYLRATIEIALTRPDIKDEILKFIKKISLS